MIVKDSQSNLLKHGLPKEHYDIYTDILDTSDEGPIKNLYSLFFNHISLIEDLSESYGHLINSHEVVLNTDHDLFADKRGQGTGFFHECAHWIDYEMYLQINKEYGKAYSVEYSGGILAKNLIREIKKLVLEIQNEKLIPSEEAKAIFFSQLKEMNPAVSHNISTLVDGVYRGKYTSQLPYGQSRLYWSNHDLWLNQLTKEIFAEFMEAHITSVEALDWIRKNLPETLGTFEEIIELMWEDLDEIL